MTAYKAQHYVPKCYLRQFASDTSRRSISLYNLRSEKFISGAPIRHQCAKTNFYGDDLVLERAFQPLEGEYASTVQAIMATASKPPSWFSGMPFRAKPKFIDTQSGRGLVRVTAPRPPSRLRLGEAQGKVRMLPSTLTACLVSPCPELLGQSGRSEHAPPHPCREPTW